MSVSDNSTVAVLREDDLPYDSPGRESVDHEECEVSTLWKSPYVDSEIVSLDAGVSATRFLIHSSKLQQSAPLFALASKGQHISLPKLDEAAAHTLIHYLYASVFQIRHHHTPNHETVKYENFKLATCVYCAAVCYELPHLAELSKEKIAETGEYLDISETLEVARDHAFSLLPLADAWYSEYLENILRKAIKQDPEPFRQPDFITKIEGNSRLLQVVWKAAMSYAVAPAQVEEAIGSGVETPLAESALNESDLTSEQHVHQLPSPTESVVNSPSPPKNSTFEHDEPSLVPDAFKYLDASPEVLPTKAQATPQLYDVLNDDFGLPAIEPTFGQAKEVGFSNKPLINTTKPRHVRADSVVEGDATASTESLEDAKHDTVSEGLSGASNGTHDSARRNKKKSRKRHSSITF